VGLVNPLDVAQAVEIEALVEGERVPRRWRLVVAAKSRMGWELAVPKLAAFGTLVHFQRQGIASLVLRRESDFFGPSALLVTGQMFCRQEAP
jgi:hypothetical protein